MSLYKVCYCVFTYTKYVVDKKTEKVLTYCRIRHVVF